MAGINERAEKYAESVIGTDTDIWYVRNDMLRMVAAAYADGGADARSGQWYNAAEHTPDVDAPLLIMYKPPRSNMTRMGVASYSAATKRWCHNFRIADKDIIAWMYIPHCKID